MFTKQIRELERQDTVVTYKKTNMDIREQYRERAIRFAEQWRADVSEHIIDIMVSIMVTRDKVLYPGGGFVQAIVANDLYLAFSRADDECSKHLKLLVMCKVNCFV
jgi:DNA-binding MurR/RpiR family transcriptional regulator